MIVYCDGSTNGIYCHAVDENTFKVNAPPEREYTSNEMEYLAVIYALFLLRDGDEIRTDSQLVVYHLNGKYDIKANNLKPLYHIAKQMLKHKKIRLTWIPREKNIAGQILEKW